MTLTLSELVARMFFALFVVTMIMAFQHAEGFNHSINQLLGR